MSKDLLTACSTLCVKVNRSALDRTHTSVNGKAKWSSLVHITEPDHFKKVIRCLNCSKSSQSQWCKQDQILKTKIKTKTAAYKIKTKITRPRPRPPEVNKGTWRIQLLSKWTPLLISTVVMFQAQNREIINSTWKVVCVLQDHYDDERDKTTQHQTCKTKTTVCKTKIDCLVSDRSCPKTDGLRPHHCSIHKILS